MGTSFRTLPLQGPPRREFLQLLSNERLTEAHIPSHLWHEVRLHAKQMRFSRGCVVVLLHNGDVLTWGHQAQNMLVHRLHNIDTLSTNPEGCFVLQNLDGREFVLDHRTMNLQR